jgi:HNH endonuclease
MGSYVSQELRRFVAERADYLCEYCLVHEEDRGFGCQVDHIISEKHGGATEGNNLAYACAPCNRAKGSNIGSIVEGTTSLIRLYNPRTDKWHKHFKLDGPRIVGVTEIGEVTIKILRLNDDERVLEREILRAGERYPSVAALRRMRGIS